MTDSTPETTPTDPLSSTKEQEENRAENIPEANSELYELRKNGGKNKFEWRHELTGWQKAKWSRGSR